MATPELTDRPESWPVERSEDRHRDDWVIALREDWLRPPDRPDDEPFGRLVLEHPGAVVILAVDEEERVLCLWQYRHPAQRRLIELPAGLCDVSGEEPEEVARRELVEEAGLEAREWIRLSSTYSSPGISAEMLHYFLARGLTVVDRGSFVAEHEEAEMQAGWVPFDDLRAAVLDGRVSDSHTALAVLLADARGLAGPTRPRG
jgi:8-oxo-dGDP phosphatase